jgi:acetyltransferase
MTDIDSIARTVCRVHGQATAAGKTFACSFMGARDVASGIQILQSDNVPHYILPEAACAAMSDVLRFREWRDRPHEHPAGISVRRDLAAQILDSAPDGYLPEPQALEVLRAYGLNVPDYHVVDSPARAAAAADRIGYPVVIRAVSPAIIHKSEAGAVRLNLRTHGEVIDACESMLESVRTCAGPAAVNGTLVRPMIPSGREVILGLTRDPVFGHVVMFGLGGIYVEVFKDVVFRVVPIEPSDAQEMCASLRASALLQAVRGQPPADVPSICDALVRLSMLACDFPRIAELDVNPLIVHATGHASTVADVRLRLGD